MNSAEYEQLQKQLSNLIDAKKFTDMRLRLHEQAIYRNAVMACKSVLSNHQRRNKLK